MIYKNKNSCNENDLEKLNKVKTKMTIKSKRKAKAKIILDLGINKKDICKYS